MFKVKVYKVYPKKDTDLWYLVEAPNRHVAKWVGANILNSDYMTFHTAKDMKVERWTIKED